MANAVLHIEDSMELMNLLTNVLEIFVQLASRARSIDEKTSKETIRVTFIDFH